MTPAKTAADYAAIAVAPLLIFLMISSLANFLMLIFYHGGFPQRVAWTLLMFTLGAVGIARIAIEQDRGYALGYAGILGIVTFLAILEMTKLRLLRIYQSPDGGLYLNARFQHTDEALERLAGVDETYAG